MARVKGLLRAGALATGLALLVLASIPSGGPPSGSTAPPSLAVAARSTGAAPFDHKLTAPIHFPTYDLPPARGHGLAAPRFTVDPTALYSSEPAPMGIADFGVDPATGAGYRYTTTEFVGTTDINGLTTRNNSLSDPRDLTIQLNVNFEVDDGSSVYTYWVQDVAFLNSSSRAVAFIDNVWNLSATSASMYNSTISGNGTTAYDGAVYYYYSAAAYSLAGNDVTLTYPSQIALTMTVASHAGVPGVAFSYDDGAGWVTYDNIGIRFARGYTVPGFVVDGTNYNGGGLFDDGELILGGPGGGAATQDVSSRMTMTLDFDNGHNLQAVTNAYDFGSDTAEAISNVAPAGAYWRSNGSLYADEPNGAGSLGSLYNRSFVGILNITAPLTDGNVTLNGTSYGTFIGGEMNLTVAPGTYSVALYATNGSLVGAQRIVVADGAYVPVHFGAAATYRVAFRADGLPAQAPWSITFDGQLATTTNLSVAFAAVNGTYGYSVGPVAGYTTTPWDSTVTVAGAAVNVSVHWTAFTYRLTFAATGLPAGTPWSVRINSVAYATANSTVLLSVKNGSYAYFVPGIPGYLPSPNNGVANVTGQNTTIGIGFNSASYSVTLTESGLPAGWIWAATVNGVTHSSGTATIDFGLTNGTGYAYSVTPVAGYTAANRTGTFNVTGLAVSIPIVFAPVLYALTFSESGLPAGTTWSVTVGSAAMLRSTPTITFALPNGTYPFSVGTAAPYVAGVSASSISIAGQGGSLAIPFTPVYGGLAGSVAPSSASVYLNGTLITTPAGVVNLTLPPGVYALEITLLGYLSVTENVTVRAGAVTPVTVTLQPAPATASTHRTASGGLGALSPIEWLAVVAVGLVAAGMIAGAVAVRRRRRRR